MDYIKDPNGRCRGDAEAMRERCDTAMADDTGTDADDDW
jgi:hypothetical protein